MTVSGHSKGGNRAQYVTITSCIVDKCVSFDGQGFSMEFLEKYKDEVLKRSDKIISISCEYDFVNCLFYPLPIPVENRIYLAAPYLSVGNFPKYHSPYVMIGSSGQFYRKADASLITKMANSLTLFACSVLKGEEREKAMCDAMSAFDTSEFKQADGILAAIMSLLKAMKPYIAATPGLTAINRLLDAILEEANPPLTALGTLADQINKASFAELKLCLMHDCEDPDRDIFLLTAVMNAMPGNITFGDQLELVGYLAQNIVVEPVKFIEKAAESLVNWVISCADKIVQLFSGE